LTRTYRGAGINGYIYQLLRRLPAVEASRAGKAERLAYTAFLHDPTFISPPGLAVQQSTWDTRCPWRRILWEQTRLSALSSELDLLHGLAFAAPLAARCPTVITVHDLSFLRFPDAFRPFNRSYLTLATKASARRAEHVIAVSESTRQDVISYCGVPAQRVVVIPNGVTEDFSPAPEAEVRSHARRLGLPNRFILYLGTLEPRKNLVRFCAYAMLRRMRGGTGEVANETPPPGRRRRWGITRRSWNGQTRPEGLSCFRACPQEDSLWYYRCGAVRVSLVVRRLRVTGIRGYGLRSSRHHNDSSILAGNRRRRRCAG
jgi:hypothetical protein